MTNRYKCITNTYGLHYLPVGHKTRLNSNREHDHCLSNNKYPVILSHSADLKACADSCDANKNWCIGIEHPNRKPKYMNVMIQGIEKKCIGIKDQ